MRKTYSVPGRDRDECEGIMGETGIVMVLEDVSCAAARAARAERTARMEKRML